MPFYDYECSKCGQITEKIYPIEACPEKISCICGGMAKKIIGSGGLQTDGNVPWLASVIDQLKPDYDKKPVETRTEFKKYLKSHGLVWTG